MLDFAYSSKTGAQHKPEHLQGLSDGFEPLRLELTQLQIVQSQRRRAVGLGVDFQSVVNVAAVVAAKTERM